MVELSDVVERVTIPTLPEVVTRVNALVNDPKVSIQEIGDVIAMDAPISSKVLRIANSAIYGLSEPARSVVDAAKVIGARALRNIALQASIIQHYDHLASVEDFDVQAVWHHSIFVARLAQCIGERATGRMDVKAEELYTCGLLHDIGKVVLLESLGDEYLEVFREARDERTPVHVVEEQRLGFRHTQVGAAVAASWKFPERIARVIECHHGPRDAMQAEPAVAVVAVADQIGYRMEMADFDETLWRLRAVSSRMIGVDGAAFAELVDYAREILPLIEV